jgi:hypothetical protein
MTQNPGAAKKQVISKVGLLGYLAPVKDVKSGGGFTAETVVDGGDIVEGIKAVNSLDTLKEWVSDSGNWQRIGLYTLGFLLLIFAVVYLFRKDAMKIVKEATK